MSSQQQGSQKLRRNVSPASKTSGPLRATLPVSFMVHSEAASPNPAASKSNQSGRGRTTCNRARQSPWRIRQWSPTPKVEKSSETTDTASFNPPAVIRRTASLDAIYAKGLWPRGNYSQFGSHLLVDKSTQTPDEWAQLDDWRYQYRGMEASPSRDWKQKQRLCLPVHQYSVSPGRVVASTNTEAMSVMTSPAIPVPSRQLVPPRVRNSVEGFSTEVERLIWTNQESCAAKINEPTPDGHRAPIAELFHCSSSLYQQRSVNTQTPVAAPGSTHSSSGNSSPVGSVSPLVWYDPWQPRPDSAAAATVGGDRSGARMAGPGDADQLHSLSPEVFHEFQGLSLCGGGGGSGLGTSPSVSRFLCREPPDGCEKVTLKAVEQSYRLVQDLPSVCYGPPKPSSQFVLQPSSSSAFCPLPPYNKAAAFNQESTSPPLRPPVQNLPPGSGYNEFA